MATFSVRELRALLTELATEVVGIDGNWSADAVFIDPSGTERRSALGNVIVPSLLYEGNCTVRAVLLAAASELVERGISHVPPMDGVHSGLSIDDVLLGMVDLGSFSILQARLTNESARLDRSLQTASFSRCGPNERGEYLQARIVADFVYQNSSRSRPANVSECLQKWIEGRLGTGADLLLEQGLAADISTPLAPFSAGTSVVDRITSYHLRRTVLVPDGDFGLVTGLVTAAGLARLGHHMATAPSIHALHRKADLAGAKFAGGVCLNLADCGYPEVSGWSGSIGLQGTAAVLYNPRTHDAIGFCSSVGAPSMAKAATVLRSLVDASMAGN